MQCHAHPPCSCPIALRIPLLPLLHQHSSQCFTQCLNMLFCPFHFICRVNHSLLSNGALANIHILFTQGRSARVWLHLHHYPPQITMCSKGPFKRGRIWPLSITGHLQFPSPSKALGPTLHLHPGLCCDICSQTERQREKVALPAVPGEDWCWAEPSARRAAHLYI